MSEQVSFKAGDRILYRKHAKGALHEGVMKEVSKIAYKMLCTDSGIVWVEKDQIEVVEILPPLTQKGEKNAERINQFDAVLNDG